MVKNIDDQRTMSKPNLLITGATGYVGFRVLITALEAGYSVRCVVRSQSKADELLANPVMKRLSLNHSICFTIVPDFAAKGAFCQSLQGVSYVIHVASPVPGPGKTDWERDIIEPAVKSTTELLTSAEETGGIQRIVITSSVAGIVPYSVLTFGDESNKTWTANDRIPIDHGPYENHTQAYNASKAMALEAIASFMESKNPSFDVINIFPGWVIGRNDLAKDPAGTVTGTNSAALGHVLGHQSSRATAPIVGHVNDVALAHVLALDSRVQGNQNLGVCLDSDWSLALEMVRKNFPQAVKEGVFPLNGHQANVKLQFDSSKTEEVLGFKLSDFESQVVSVAGHYLEELAKPGAKPVDLDLLQI